MKAHSSDTISLHRALLHPKTLMAFSLLFAAAAANFITGSWIQSYLPNEIVSPDLLLLHLPYVSEFHTIAELSLMTGLLLLLLALVISKRHLNSLPYFILNLATVYAARALLITITPLAQTSPIKEQPNFYGVTFSGMYPSGHIALSTIIFLLIRKYGSNVFATKVSGALVVIQAISLIFSHSHYGIDIVGE